MVASEEDQIEHLVARLAQKHPEVDLGTIGAIIEDARHQFEGNRIRDFVPLFVERRAEGRLQGRSSAQSERLRCSIRRTSSSC